MPMPENILNGCNKNFHLHRHVHQHKGYSNYLSHRSKSEKSLDVNFYSESWAVLGHLQGSTNRRALGLVNFVPALAHHFCLNLPAAFSNLGPAY